MLQKPDILICYEHRLAALRQAVPSRNRFLKPVAGTKVVIVAESIGGEFANGVVGLLEFTF